MIEGYKLIDCCTSSCCDYHLSGNLFTKEAMDVIVATKTSVVMTDAELSAWILAHGGSRSRNSGRRRYNFDDATDVKNEDYPRLVGLTKDEFDIMLLELSGKVYNTENRSVRNALAIFLMVLRHGMTQVFYTLS